MDHSLMPLYNRAPTAFAHGEGAYLWDTHGNQYLDFLAGIAVVSLGHSHPAITQAICDQASQLMQVSNGYEIPEQTQLADKLIELTGMDNASFCNSGCEAVEAAIKLARLYGKEKGIASPKIITMHGAFHGRTMATISAIDNPTNTDFQPLLEGFIHCPYNDIETLKTLASNHPDVVAVLLEPVQGEGGIIVPEDHYLEQVREVCDQHDHLMILDEIQTGIGRTGQWFAFMHTPIKPDILCSAKALGNGFPVGAYLARGKASSLFKVGHHGSTFGGNPLAMKVALTVIEQIEKTDLLNHVTHISQYLSSQLKQHFEQHDNVINIRNKGLMLGIELKDPCTDIRNIGLKNGILFSVTRQKIIRMVPPLIITEQHVDEFITGLEATFAEFFAKQPVN